MRRSRATRREEPLDGHPGADRPADAPGPADTALLVDGIVHAVWAQGGQPRVVFVFAISDGSVVAIDLVACPYRLRDLDVTVLES
jgi:hypothetical protein